MTTNDTTQGGGMNDYGTPDRLNTEPGTPVVPAASSPRGAVPLELVVRAVTSVGAAASGAVGAWVLASAGSVFWATVLGVAGLVASAELGEAKDRKGSPDPFAQPSSGATLAPGQIDNILSMVDSGSITADDAARLLGRPAGTSCP